MTSTCGVQRTSSDGSTSSALASLRMVEACGSDWLRSILAIATWLTPLKSASMFCVSTRSFRSSFNLSPIVVITGIVATSSVGRLYIAIIYDGAARRYREFIESFLQTIYERYGIVYNPYRRYKKVPVLTDQSETGTKAKEA